MKNRFLEWSRISLILCLFRSTVYAGASDSEKLYDVVVYGGTSAGVVAVVQVVRMGKTVLLIEPGKHLGGLSSGGLGFTDSGNKDVIGGIGRDFYRRIKKHYDNPGAWVHEKSSDYGRYRPEEDAMWAFEPHVAESIFNEMVREAGVSVVFGERLDLKAGVQKTDSRIVSIRMESGHVYHGKMFIDATYEGDLTALAGVSCTVGREGNGRYGETLNGVQTERAKSHQFIRDVDPHVKPGNPRSGLLFGIDPEGPGEESSGDHRIQAYNFRMCLTDVYDNQIPFEKPDGYDESQYELLLRNVEAGDDRIPLKIDMMPNRKTDINNNFAVSTDFIGQNYGFPEGDYVIREKIIRAHASYIKGFMWTLTNHPRISETVRSKVKTWGWARDEFVDNDHFPHQIYVREARRMVSDFVMTELHCRRQKSTPESVGMGSYNMDSHNTQRYITREGFVRNEGDVQVNPGGPYPISYRAIVPREKECGNLLVPVCLSASHISYGSVRMEPVFMILGQSAATAAVLAVQGQTSVQRVDYPSLRKRLLADGQVLEWKIDPDSTQRQK